ncbi:hypothetical protein ACIRPK_34050 [Kitasatospora sp. NPDC101801]|uniref:hypothetical protein n=1 Tax=Kitasatospora sp. NPDC101801 TaxID=3364103 RepID=UPI0037FD6062
MTTSQPRGQVLMVAAAPSTSRRRLLDPEQGVAAFGTVPAGLLVPGWPGPVDVVELVQPSGPQAVLARLQAAVAVEGPLLVYVCGQLVRDRRQHQVHLALASTTDSTIRYTALPWPWLARALASRQPATTGVVLDLTADPACWPLEPAELALPPQVAAWGVVSPPVRRGPWQVPEYTAALAALLKSTPPGQHVAQLHQVAVHRAGLHDQAVVLGLPPVPAEEEPAARVPVPAPRVFVPPPMPNVPPAAPVAVPVAAAVSLGRVAPPTAGPDPRVAIAEAMQAGRHHTAAELAARWESEVLRTSGRESALMGDVLEVQAAAAAASGAVVRATERWITTARHRLVWAPPTDPAVRQAIENARALWLQLDDDEHQAAELGHRLVEVLREAGAERPAAAVEARLAGLSGGGQTYRPPTAWTG